MSKSVVRLLPDGDPQTGLQPCQFTDPAAVIAGESKEVGHSFYTNEAGNVTSGVWEATPYTEAVESYPVDEFMVVLAGSVTLTDSEGHSETFNKGDTFLVPKGFKGTWQITETLRKFYMIVE